MTVYFNGDYSSFKVYNSHGKMLFNGNNYNNFYLGEKYILVSNDKNYEVYDLKLNPKTSSKIYDKILGLYDDFVAVIDNNHLEVLDTNDEILATFDLEWNSNYFFYSSFSGIYEENGSRQIRLIVANNEIPDGTKGRELVCYYDLDTKELGIIEKEYIGL